MDTSVEVWVASVLTGQRWQEKMFLFDTVHKLKSRVAQRVRLPAHRQAILFAGRELLDGVTLEEAGVRAHSQLQLVPVARAGPVEYEHAHMCVMSDDPSDRERRGRASAPEDTSAKESSAGETEAEGPVVDEGAVMNKLAEASASRPSVSARKKTNSISQWQPAKGVADGNCALSAPPPALPPQLELIALGEQREERESEDGPSASASEFSSGMIVCELANDLRKLKVRRRHHAAAAPVKRGRSRQRERGDAGSSSEDCADGEEREELPTVPSATTAARRAAASARGGAGRTGAHSRCAVCAFRLTNPLNCRCGKTLCSRHRAAQAHTCTKQKRTERVTGE